MATKHGNLLSGKVPGIGEQLIATSWKGMQVFRRQTGKIDQIKSEARGEIVTNFSLLAPRYMRVLTDPQRNAWDQYAKMMNSQSSEESDRIGAGSHNIIRPRGRIVSGMNAYMMANMLAFTRGLAIPRDDAPIAAPAPNPASVLTLAVAGGVATVTWTDPDISAWPPGSSLVAAIHCQIQCKKRIHTQIAVLAPLPTPGSATFDSVRTGGAYGSPTLPLSTFAGGQLRVQMDTVGAISDVQGAVVSPPSTVLVATIA